MMILCVSKAKGDNGFAGLKEALQRAVLCASHDVESLIVDKDGAVYAIELGAGYNGTERNDRDVVSIVHANGPQSDARHPTALAIRFFHDAGWPMAAADAQRDRVFDALSRFFE